MERKIGVYICECGPNIAEKVDIDKVIDAVSSLDDVAVVEEPLVVVEPEPYMIEEPVAVVAAVVVPEPEPVPLSAEEQVMSMDAGYAVQIFASSNMASGARLCSTSTASCISLINRKSRESFWRGAKPAWASTSRVSPAFSRISPILPSTRLPLRARARIAAL